MWFNIRCTVVFCVAFHPREYVSIIAEARAAELVTAMTVRKMKVQCRAH
jgi:hypothetical protein